MEEAQIHVPAMYADHHVLEVRRVLLEIPGVAEVVASSCFHTVKVTFDPAQATLEVIHSALEAAGYLQPMLIPVESGVASYGNNRTDNFFRHTSAYEQTKQVIQFDQRVEYSGKPLWPCPGMGVISRDKDGQNG
jgi:copper chaperone CopZ